MYQIQQFMTQRIHEENTGKRNILPPIINPKFPETSNCSIPACESCMMDFSKKI